MRPDPLLMKGWISYFSSNNKYNPFYRVIRHRYQPDMRLTVFCMDIPNKNCIYIISRSELKKFNNPTTTCTCTLSTITVQRTLTIEAVGFTITSYLTMYRIVVSNGCFHKHLFYPGTDFFHNISVPRFLSNWNISMFGLQSCHVPFVTGLIQNRVRTSIKPVSVTEYRCAEILLYHTEYWKLDRKSCPYVTPAYGFAFFR